MALFMGQAWHLVLGCVRLHQSLFEARAGTDARLLAGCGAQVFVQRGRPHNAVVMFRLMAARGPPGVRGIQMAVESLSISECCAARVPGAGIC